MEALTAEEFAQITGINAPSDFNVSLVFAQEAIDAHTLYAYVGRDFDSLPAVITERYKRALALQTLYISQMGGVAAMAEDAPNSVSLGSYSYSGGNTAESQSSLSGELSPAVRLLLPVLVGYARGLQA